MLWTDEAVEILKRLALEGRSASTIAQALGAASRSAVIGKANRIGVKLNGGGRASILGGAPAGAPPAQLAAIPRPQPVPRKQTSAPAPSGDPRVVPGSQPGDGKQRMAEWTPAEPEVGEMRRVKLEDLRGFACRWPLGDPRSGEFAFCGLKPADGHPYCAGHCRIAYRPPKARASQNARERRWSRPLANPWRAR